MAIGGAQLGALAREHQAIIRIHGVMKHQLSAPKLLSDIVGIAEKALRNLLASV